LQIIILVHKKKQEKHQKNINKMKTDEKHHTHIEKTLKTDKKNIANTMKTYEVYIYIAKTLKTQ